MNILVKRYNSTNDYTDGLLFVDCEFMCYTLEDEYRNVKVYGETRIPDGTYKIGIRNEGGFHNRYKEKYSFHQGMLQIQDVPNFEYILIHVGNTDADTAGCLLVGSTADKDKGFIGGSSRAYKELYPIILKAINSGEEVVITFESNN